MSYNQEQIIHKVKDFYQGKLQAYGASAKGVDWRDEATQALRFKQFIMLFEQETQFSLIDYGCGYGALYDYLSDLPFDFDYQGFDISDDMISVARNRHVMKNNAEFLTEKKALKPADFVVASGLFNVSLDTNKTEWEEYLLETLFELNKLSKLGFAFNILSAQSDKKHQRPDLYYANPGFLMDYCAENFSRCMVVKQDYHLYEFTLIVKKKT